MKQYLIAIFIILHGQYDKPFHINAEMIRSYWDIDEPIGKDKGMIEYANGDTRFVRETADDITLMISDEISRQRAK